MSEGKTDAVDNAWVARHEAALQASIAERVQAELAYAKKLIDDFLLLPYRQRSAICTKLNLSAGDGCSQLLPAVIISRGQVGSLWHALMGIKNEATS